ncbi:MAG TPA: TMEM165/GDT1 family protein [Candidatus Margulisiibacteriota bacterium]|nr:TMEM165/GDT1 family protein [Candidatus Margulisiibacteriota bacterium]
MDWRLVVSTFSAIILAEIGDKTQIAVLTLTASSNRPLSVFVGASVALVSGTLMGVIIGVPIAEVLPIAYLRKAGACVFIAIGVAILVDWL